MRLGIANCVVLVDGKSRRMRHQTRPFDHYFNGKAGLLLALITHLVSQQVVDLIERFGIAPTAEEEIVQLVNWEVGRMWADREFLTVIIPTGVARFPPWDKY
jgi:hypothetical protein